MTNEHVPDHCPTCGSVNPKLHPAVNQGGEVQPCRDQWHTAKPEPDTLSEEEMLRREGQLTTAPHGPLGGYLMEAHALARSLRAEVEKLEEHFLKPLLDDPSEAQPRDEETLRYWAQEYDHAYCKLGEVERLDQALRLLTKDGPNGEAFECPHGVPLDTPCVDDDDPTPCEFDVVRAALHPPCPSR